MQFSQLVPVLVHPSKAVWNRHYLEVDSHRRLRKPPSHALNALLSGSKSATTPSKVQRRKLYDFMFQRAFVSPSDSQSGEAVLESSSGFKGRIGERRYALI